jgi:hypothetical protein
MAHLRAAVMGIVLLGTLSACDTGAEPTTTTIVASSLVSDPDPTTTVTYSWVLPLVADVCGLFDGAQLGTLTALNLPLALVQSEETASRVVCSFTGTGDGVDATVRVEVDPLDSRSAGYFRTAGDFETEMDVAGQPGVGTGRGSLRAELLGVGGLTLTVTLRTLSSEVTPLRDGDHLDIRDVVAAYVVDRLLTLRGF